MEKEDAQRTAKSERLQRAGSGSRKRWRRSRMSSCDSRVRSRFASQNRKTAVESCNTDRDREVDSQFYFRNLFLLSSGSSAL